MTVRRRARSERAIEAEQLLPEAEMEILAFLHDWREADARSIREGLAGFRPMSHASVLTLLGRLQGKGLVTRKKAPVGKAFIYTATHSPRPLYRHLMRRLVGRIFANDTASLVASLFEAKPPTDHELGQIRTLVDEMARRKKR